MSTQNRQRLGVLTRSFGLLGGIRCALDSIVVPQIQTPCTAWIGYSESFVEERRLALTENHSGSLICYFEGVSSRDAADALADRALWIESDRIRFEDPFSDSRIIGFRVHDEQGNHLGSVVDIIGSRTQFVWTIAFEEREWMMPAVDEFVRDIRMDEKLIIVRPIPGMFDDEAV